MLSEKQRISPKADSPSLTNRVYHTIFQEIITGKIPGETMLVAATLAQQLGVSITPVRESLLRLANEGLVKPIPRVGYIVEAMSEAEVIDLFEARIGIERLAASLAVEKVTPAEVDFLQNNLQRMNEVIQQGRTEEMIGLDTSFHQFIAQATRNRTLFSVSQLIIQRTYRFRYACIRIMEIAQSTRDQHSEIVKAFREKNPQKVDSAMLAHLGGVKSQIFAYLGQLRLDSLGPL